jgi:hypothetical protein
VSCYHLDWRRRGRAFPFSFPRGFEERLLRLEDADAALAEDYVVPASAGYVFGGEQSLFDGSREAALQDNPAIRARYRGADTPQEGKVGHIASPYLQYLGVLHNQLYVVGVHDLGRIRIIDDDLGRSGRDGQREGFKELVGAVSLWGRSASSSPTRPAAWRGAMPTGTRYWTLPRCSAPSSPMWTAFMTLLTTQRQITAGLAGDAQRGGAPPTQVTAGCRQTTADRARYLQTATAHWPGAFGRRTGGEGSGRAGKTRNRRVGVREVQSLG